MDTNGTPGAIEYGIRAPEHRLPSATRLGRVRLQVSNVGRSLAYYREVLGLGVFEESAGRTVLGVQKTGEPLIELYENPGAAPVPNRGRLGLFHFAILLPERAALGRFLRHLGEIGERAGASDHLVSEAVYLQDPDGLGIEVYADRSRSEWKQWECQLVMGTEPLDIDGVVRIAGSEPWIGMPAGTTIGHIHLHVGDLDEAASFYHRALGLDKVVWSYPGALFLSAGGYHHHLGLNTWAGQAAPAAEGDARLLEWELVVPSARDADETARSLETGGYQVERVDGIVARDPWGTALRIRKSEPT